MKSHNLIYTFLTIVCANSCSLGVSAPSVPIAIPLRQSPQIDVDNQNVNAFSTTIPVQASCTTDSKTFNNAMLVLINKARSSSQRCGNKVFSATSNLQWNSALAKAAFSHSTDMAMNYFFSHHGSNGQDVADRASVAGYHWRALGENIAAGQHTVNEVHNDWLQSPGHCKNIMNVQYQHVGASCIEATDSSMTSYWTVVFGQ